MVTSTLRTPLSRRLLAAAVISGTVKYLDLNFVAPLGLSETAASSLLGFAVSSALIGCVLGGMVGGVVASALGRKRGLMIAAVLFIISAVGSAYPEMGFPHGAPHTFLTQFIIYRIIGGVGVGLASMLSPMYIAEMAPASRRGGLVAWNQFAIIFGMLVVYFVNYFIALNGDEAWLTSTGWRLMFLSEVIPAALLFLLVLGVPESPRWLIMKGREAKAVAILERIMGAPEAEVEAQSIRRSLHGTVKAKLFSYGVGVIVIGMLLSVFQQFIGINVVLYYAPEIFRNMGMGTNAALAQTIIVGVINLSFTVLAIFTVDRFGRQHGDARDDFLPGTNGISLFAGDVVLRSVVRSLLGPDLLGASRRNIPEQDPQPGDGTCCRGAMGRQLSGLLDLPDDG